MLPAQAVVRLARPKEYVLMMIELVAIFSYYFFAISQH